MTLPTAAEVTEMFLFGAAGRPGTLLDPSIIRPDSASSQITIQNVDVMSSSGPGRFAVGALFDAIQLFFSPTTSGLAPGTYTKAQIYAEFGLDTLQERALIFQQAAYDDGNPDYAYRAYVFNTMTFEIQDGAEFVVEPNGQRYIQNYAITVSDDVQDNFDFNGGSLASLGNNLLEELVDPSGIGRTLNFNYTGTVPTKTYDFSDFQSETSMAASWSFSPSKLFDDMMDLTKDLFDTGVTKLDENDNAVVFGNLDEDAVNVENKINIYHKDLADNGIQFVGSDEADEANSINSVRDITFHGFAGEDSFIGGYGNDTLFGGEDVDHLFGAAGADELYGESGADELHGGAGNDILFGGTEADSLYGDADWDIAAYWLSTVGVTIDLTNTANSTGEAKGDT